MCNCEVCGDGGPNACVFRVNKPGEMPARWRCRECLTANQKAAVPEDVKEIVRIIQGREDQ